MIRAHYFKSVNNFGDQLVGPIIKWLCGEDVAWVGNKVEGKLLCIGSEITRGVMRKNDVVWGYGGKYQKDMVVPEGVKILATRGKKTAALLKDTRVNVFGDPALLIAKVHKAPERTEEYNIGIIPHFTDAKFFTHIKHKKAKLFNILDDKWKIIEDMHKCKVILSTSLHGCIVAEAYGIPVVWIKPAKSIVGGLEFKWNDYFSGTGRPAQKPYQLPHPITLKDLGKAKFQTLPKPIIDTTKLEKVWRDFYKSPGINKIRK